MGTELRIFIRILIETLKNLKRANWMNWVIISTMAAILSIFGCMFRFTLGLDTIIKQLGSNLEVSVYLKDGSDAKAFLNDVKTFDNVRDVDFISKDTAWEEMKKQYNVLDIKNPLPDTIHLKVQKNDDIQPLVERLKAMDIVESVSYPENIAAHMKKLAKVTTFVTILLVILLGGLTLFIISNTIQLLIQSCGREIEIMSMMGVSSAYIKTPYIIQGALYGLLGSILALIPLYILQSYIVKVYNYFNTFPPQLNMNIVVLAILFMGLFVGATGSFISVKKHLKI